MWAINLPGDKESGSTQEFEAIGRDARIKIRPQCGQCIGCLQEENCGECTVLDSIKAQFFVYKFATYLQDLVLLCSC